VKRRRGRPPLTEQQIAAMVGAMKLVIEAHPDWSIENAAEHCATTLERPP